MSKKTNHATVRWILLKEAFQRKVFTDAFEEVTLFPSGTETLVAKMLTIACWRYALKFP